MVKVRKISLKRSHEGRKINQWFSTQAADLSQKVCKDTTVPVPDQLNQDFWLGLATVFSEKLLRCLLSIGIRHFIVLCRYGVFLQMEVCGSPASNEQVCQHYFSHSTCLLHVCITFSNSHIMNSFIIIIPVMTLCYQWSLMLLLSLFWGTTN